MDRRRWCYAHGYQLNPSVEARIWSLSLNRNGPHYDDVDPNGLLAQHSIPDVIQVVRSSFEVNVVVDSCSVRHADSGLG